MTSCTAKQHFAFLCFAQDNDGPVPCTYLTPYVHKMDVTDIPLLVWIQSGANTGNIMWIAVAKHLFKDQMKWAQHYMNWQGPVLSCTLATQFAQPDFISPLSSGHLPAESYNSQVEIRAPGMCITALSSWGICFCFICLLPYTHRSQTHISAKYTKRKTFSHHNLCVAESKHSSFVCQASYCSAVCFWLCQENATL